RAGFLLHAVHESTADAVYHAVGDVRGDDLAPQRVRMHRRLVAAAQRRGEIALDRRRYPRIAGNVRGDELFVERDLRVGQEHRAFGRSQAEFGGAALGELLVARQELDRTVEASRLLQTLDEALLWVEQRGRERSRHREAL